MSEEKNNVEIIPEFKMYITDLETERDSKEINVSDLIFDDYIEFEFGNYEDEDYATLPYNDFKFFINDYSVTFYCPQMKELQKELQQKENIIKEVREYIEKAELGEDTEGDVVYLKDDLCGIELLEILDKKEVN